MCIQANISKQKSVLQKQTTAMKLQQKDAQTAELELGMNSTALSCNLF